ncbi:hypothetical protein DFJ74DRAFT_477614 [Hyaloraphidium curvatum]|nr:hypothetical protein DFJ74DRAFT_477614 [Hyaloraphidium curvatum]
MFSTGARKGLLDRLQQQFLEGQLTDVVVRVRVGEKAVSGASNCDATADVAEEGGPESERPDAFVDIRAHTNVLCARSDYFAKCLSGDWVEAERRRVELALPDEQALEDLKLLFKLSYSDSFVRDGGKLLPLDVRLRLAERADALEFVDAVENIVVSLPEGLDFDAAVKCVSELPAFLEEHPLLPGTKLRIVPLLAKGIEERAGRGIATDAAVVALAKCLGPVCGMFVSGLALVEGTLALRKEVKDLSPAIFKRVLGSDALQLQLENEAYHLLVAWLHQSPHVPSREQRAALFRDLLPKIRFNHVALDFLGNAVAFCPLMQASGMLPSVIRAAGARKGASMSVVNAANVAQGPRDRGVAPSEACWYATAAFTLAEIAGLAPGFVGSSAVSKWSTLVGGYPTALVAQHSGDGSDTPGSGSLGIFLQVSLPPAGVAIDGSAEAGIALKAEFNLPAVAEKSFSAFLSGKCWGWKDMFSKPWFEVVKQDSPFFPGGWMTVRAKVRLALE